MAYSIMKNSTPRSVHFGTDDRSVPETVAEAVVEPIHFPLSFTFASRGPHDRALFGAGNGLLKMYGSDLFDYDSDYTTFNTPFIKLFSSNANPQFIQRLIPDDAKIATLRLYAEVYTDDVPQYTEDADGLITQTGTMPGRRIIWHTAAITDTAPLAAGKIYAGNITGTDGVKSKIYPILDMPISSYGKYGKNVAFRLAAMTTASNTPVNTDIVDGIRARLYSIQFVEREDETASPVITKTIDGDVSVVFSFKKGAYYRDLKMNLGYERTVLKAYRDMNPDPGYMPKLGPISSFYVYDDNLANVLDDINSIVGLPDKYLIDIFGGTDIDGNPYNGLAVDDGTLGGEVFGSAINHYFLDGSDGTMSNVVFDELVRRQMANFGEMEVPYLDMLKYPVRHLYDAGYSIATKEAMANFVAKLPSTQLVLSPWVFGHAEYDMATEKSVSTSLSSMIRAIPESERYGTPQCRTAIVGHTYYLNDSDYMELVPCTYSLANKASKRAGSQAFKSAYRYNRGEKAIVDEGYGINLTSKSDEAQNYDNDIGMMTIRPFDTYQYFFPVCSTVYKEQRSILRGWETSMCVAYLNSVGCRVWAEMTGVQDMTNSEIVDAINEKIAAKVHGVFDDAVKVVPNARFTEADIANGYSVHIDILVYGNVPNTVEQWTIVAYRQE